MRGSRFCTWGAFALLTTGWSIASAEERHVIGVATYWHAPQLANTPDNARADAGSLERFVCQVGLPPDLDRNALEAVARRRAQCARGAVASLFDCTDHEFETTGSNWRPGPTPAAASTRSDPSEATTALPNPPLTRLAQTAQAPPAALPPQAREALLARLAAISPGMSPQRRDEIATRYEAMRGHKAQAVSSKDSNAWRAGGDSPEAAEQNTLEACQVRYGRGCVLVAVNDKVQPASGAVRGREMPRVRYDGQFEPSRIPFVLATVRQRPDVAGYAAAAGPKAMAIHPWGRVFTSARAPDQRAAETRALADCNADPNRKGADGPCLLYAVGNHVVLPQRLSEPRKPAKTIAEAISHVARTSLADAYAKEAVHKALAVEIESGRSYGRVNSRSAALAEQFALEGCQLIYALPCVLIASNGDLRAPDPYAEPTRDMPRLRYEGAYRVDMVPFHVDPDKNKVLTEYVNLPEPKAMVIAPSPARIRVGTGASTAQAEAKALAACNEGDLAYPCFIYAVNNRVVLPQRRTEASR